MKKDIYLILLGSALTIFTGCSDTDSDVDDGNWKQIPTQHAATEKHDSIIDYFGTSVNDPYSWLEDDHSPQTKLWVDAENKVTEGT